MLSLLRATSNVIAAVLVAACASTPPAPPPPSPSMLTAAGFKAVVADTPLRKAHLQALPTSGVTEWQNTGRHFFVYPDAANDRLLVGTPKEYQAYLALRGKDGLANPTPNAATTVDVRSYLKQDASMEKADALAAQVPPWAIWPDFSNLGWIP